MKITIFEPRTNLEDKIFDTLVFFLLVIILLVAIYPLYFVSIASISNPDYVNRGEVFLYPRDITFDGYKLVFKDPRILTGYKNTFVYTFLYTIISVSVTVLAAFSLSRKELIGYKIFTVYFLVTMYFNGGLIPTYLVVQKLGLINKGAAIVIIGSVAIWNLIICRTFFKSTIPNELWEASAIDGCSMYQFFFKIVLPNAKAIIAIMVLYYAVAQWNDFFKSLIYLNQIKKYPLQIILRDLLMIESSISADVDPDSILEMTRQAQIIKFAVIIVASVPVLLLYPFVQKYFVKGVMIGSVKG